MIDVWIDYVSTRMEFYRDLELMRVDARGVWIDEFAPSDGAAPALDRSSAQLGAPTLNQESGVRPKP